MIIFFDWDNRGSSGPQDGQADHVGIVQKVENGIVYTIEGNFGEQLTPRIILGFVMIITAVSIVVAGGKITAPLVRFRKMFPRIKRK